MFQVNPLLGVKNQALFSSKDKSKTLKCLLQQFLFGALRVKFVFKSQLMFSLASTTNEDAPRRAQTYSFFYSVIHP